MRYLLLFLFTTKLYAIDLNPDYAVVHTGGYTGMLALGAGYDVKEYYSVEGVLGYTLPNLRSLAIRNTLRPYMGSFRTTPFKAYAGFSILYLIANKDTFVQLPKKYPRGYYPRTAIRSAPYFGCELGEEESIYFEVTALSHYLEVYTRSKGSLRVEEVGTWAIGLKKEL